MKTLRQIDWRAAGVATRWFLMAVGAIGLAAWFASAPLGLALFAAAWLAGIWYGFWKLAARGSKLETTTATNRKPRRVQPPASSAHPRKLYVYTDESGEPVYADH